MASEAQELPYRIELWDDHDTHVEELIALLADHAVARAPSRKPSGGDPAEVESAGLKDMSTFETKEHLRL